MSVVVEPLHTVVVPVMEVGEVDAILTVPLAATVFVVALVEVSETLPEGEPVAELVKRT